MRLSLNTTHEPATTADMVAGYAAARARLLHPVRRGRDVEPVRERRLLPRPAPPAPPRRAWSTPEVIEIEFPTPDDEVVVRALDALALRPPPITATVILRVFAAASRVPLKDYIGHSHRAPLVRLRHMAMALAYCCSRYSTGQIGRAFSRDHSIVVSAVRQYAPMIEGVLTRAGIPSQRANKCKGGSGFARRAESLERIGQPFHR